MRKRPPKLKSQIPDEQRYEAGIKLLLNVAKKLIRKHVEPKLEQIAQKVETRIDDEADIINTALGKVRRFFEKEVTSKDYERVAEDGARRVNKTNTANHATLMRTIIGVDPVKFEPWLDAETNLFVQNNVSLIKSLPTEVFSDIEQMLFRDGRRGLSPKELKANIKELFGATDNHAALISRDQVSKFNSSLTELRQKNAGIKEYEWATSKDGRVRTLANTGGYSDHGRLDGETFSWDSPPVTVFKGKRAGERNHPGQDIQCRCQAIPKLPKRGKT